MTEDMYKSENKFSENKFSFELLVSSMSASRFCLCFTIFFIHTAKCDIRAIPREYVDNYIYGRQLPVTSFLTSPNRYNSVNPLPTAQELGEPIPTASKFPADRGPLTGTGSTREAPKVIKNSIVYPKPEVLVNENMETTTTLLPDLEPQAEVEEQAPKVVKNTIIPSKWKYIVVDVTNKTEVSLGPLISYVPVQKNIIIGPERQVVPMVLKNVIIPPKSTPDQVPIKPQTYGLDVNHIDSGRQVPSSFETSIPLKSDDLPTILTSISQPEIPEVPEEPSIVVGVPPSSEVAIDEIKPVEEVVTSTSPVSVIKTILELPTTPLPISIEAPTQVPESEEPDNAMEEEVEDQQPDTLALGTPDQATTKPLARMPCCICRPRELFICTERKTLFQVKLERMIAAKKMFLNQLLLNPYSSLFDMPPINL